MLSFKQYIAKFPNGHNANSNRESLQTRDKSHLSEASNRVETSEDIFSKWDLIRYIAENPSESVLVELDNDRISFQFMKL